MIPDITTKDADILEVATTYAEKLIAANPRIYESTPSAHSVLDLDRLGTDFETIEKGLSGQILFLIELFKIDGDERKIIKIENAVKWLVSYCKTFSSQNFGLYNGRSGVIYTIIQLFQLTDDGALIDDCLELVKPLNQSFLNSRYTSDYLYDGRSGALLVLLELYTISLNAEILEYIRQLASKIINNTWLDDDGAYWQHVDEFSSKASCCFAFGVSGIKYVFERLKRVDCLVPVDSLIDASKKYIDSRWNVDLAMWIDRPLLVSSEGEPNSDQVTNYTGWASGAIGVWLSDESSFGSDKLRRQIVRRCTAVPKRLTEGNKMIAGKAFELSLLLLRPNLFNEDELFEMRHMQRQCVNKFNLTLDNDFLGEMGALYLMLNALNTERDSGNVFFPLQEDFFLKKHFEIKLKAEDVDWRKSVLSKYFPRTVCLLNKSNPDILVPYFKRPFDLNKGSEVEQFLLFLRTTINSPTFFAVREHFIDLLTFEINKLNFFQSTREHAALLHLENMSYRNEILFLLNSSKDWLLQQKLRLSDTVNITCSRWDWSYPTPGSNATPLPFDHVPNFQRQAGNHEYIFMKTVLWEDVESVLNKGYALLLHQFDQAKSVRQALEETFAYIRSLPDSAFYQIMQDAGGANIQQSPISTITGILSDVMLSAIKKWVYFRVLEIVK